MGVLHPMDAKMQLAHTIVANFHGEEAAKEAADEFRLVYRDRKAPTDLPEMKLAWGTRPLFAVLTETQLATSRSDAERLIKQGAVEVNGQVEKDVKRTVVLNPGDLLALRVGKKRFLRVVGV
jgi:tyrosyl-tRNA synthetase